MAAIRRNTLAELVYNELKQLVLTGELSPGMRINEVQLAQRFEVSPTPVREALNKLRGDGLVQYRGWQGAIVTQFDTQDIQNIYSIRTVLECLAIEQATPNIRPEDLIKVRDLLTKSCDYDFQERYRINNLFHQFFAKKSHNDHLQRMLKSLDDVILMIRYPLIRTKKGGQAFAEHMRIIDSVTAGNTEEAKDVMRRHIERARDESIRLVSAKTVADEE